MTGNFTVSCGGAYYGCGNGRPKCLDRGTFNLQGAITVSDNTYFATVMQKVIDRASFLAREGGGSARAERPIANHSRP